MNNEEQQKMIHKSDHFIIDTYHKMAEKSYIASALLFKGKRQVGPLQWENFSFDTEGKANEFVRVQCKKLGLKEAENVDALLSV